MKIRAFALMLMLGTLLCLAPSAAALDTQPEELASDAFAAAEPADAAEVEQPVLPDETAPADVPVDIPILPENPPTMISSTTPEEIGFVWEEKAIPEEQPDGEPVPDEDADTSADILTDVTVPHDSGTVPADTSSTAPTVPTLPQTGTLSSFVNAAICTAGGLLIAAGTWLTRHTA